MPRILLRGSALLALAAGVLSCNNNILAPPTLSNIVDTLTLSALHGTPVQAPSAYSVIDHAVRTDQTSQFEFVFDIDSVNNAPRAIFVPLAALNVLGSLTFKPGLLPTPKSFAEVTLAESNGYITDDTVTATVGQVYFVRSRLVCGSVPEYAKIEVLNIDFTARTIQFQNLSDNNCGYRGLEPGLPSE